QGFTASQPRWGITESWANPVLDGGMFEGTYTEGRDAGSLIIRAPSLVLDGTLYGQAFAGIEQIANARPGTATSSIFGHKRLVQGAPSQMPAGGFLFIQGFGQDATGNITGGADVTIAKGYNPVDQSLAFGQSISIDPNGSLVVPLRDPASLIPGERL